MTDLEVIDQLARWMNGIEDEGSSSDNEIHETEGDESSVTSFESVESENHEEHPSGFIPLSMGLDHAEIDKHGVIISSNGPHKITATEVQEHLIMPDYPDTSNEGIVHFIHSKNPMENLSEDTSISETSLYQAFTTEMSRIQFGTHHSGKVKVTKLKILAKEDDNSASRAWHRSYQCSGIAYCEYAHDSIINACSAYDRVKVSDLNRLRLQAGRPHVSQQIDEMLKQQTEEYFNAFMRNWIVENQCKYPNGEIITCRDQLPAMFQRNNVWYIGCPKNSDLEPWHTAQSIPLYSARVDIPYLRLLAEYGHSEIRKDCIFVGPANSKKKFCDQFHPQGPGKIYKSKCKAKFDLYIPTKWDRFPFLVLVTRGYHAHHPPPPTKLPKEIASEVIESIRDFGYDCLDLTARRFIVSPKFADIHRKFGQTALNALERSLNVQDRITALIRKQRLLAYPEGTSLAGVFREFNFDRLKNSDEQWIRDVHFFDPEHYLIICCTYAQAKAFTKVQCIEMDLSFKMIQGNTNVFSISAWNADAHQTRQAYATMFSKIFQILGDVARSPIRFPYIHGGEEGIRTVTVDMCKKQAPGFGDFLHELDPTREWQEHLQHILIFCKTHVQRNFRKKFGDHEARHRLHLIWEARTKEDVINQLDSLATVYPNISKWVKSKKKTWILAGLSPEQSKIPIKWWTFARDHSGISESSHFQDNNFTGRKQSMLAAVLKLKNHSREMFAASKLAAEEGIHNTWRNKSNTLRLAQQMRGTEKKQRKAAERRVKHPKLPFNPRNPFDSPVPGMLPSPKLADNASSAVSPMATSIVPMPMVDMPKASSAYPEPTPIASSSYPASEPRPIASSAYPEPTPIARRHLRQESAEEVENAAHRERIQKMQEKLEGLRRRMGEEEEAIEMQLQREIAAFERRLAREC